MEASFAITDSCTRKPPIHESLDVSNSHTQQLADDLQDVSSTAKGAALPEVSSSKHSKAQAVRSGPSKPGTHKAVNPMFPAL